MPTAPSTLRHELQTLYADHQVWLIGWLNKRMAGSADALDLAQDTWLRVLGNPQAREQIREPRAWLRTIAHGLVVDHWRRKDLERAYLDALACLPEAEAPSPEVRLLLLEALARIDALLDGMPPRVRTAFLLSRLEGLSYPEIAARLGVSLSSVEKYMATAIRHCFAIRLA